MASWLHLRCNSWAHACLEVWNVGTLEQAASSRWPCKMWCCNGPWPAGHAAHAVPCVQHGGVRSTEGNRRRGPGARPGGNRQSVSLPEPALACMRGQQSQRPCSRTARDSCAPLPLCLHKKTHQHATRACLQGCRLTTGDGSPTGQPSRGVVVDSRCSCTTQAL